MIKENNGTTKYRLTQVECEVKELNDKVDKILENHLPHLKEEMVKMRADFAKEINELKLSVTLSESEIKSTIEQNRLKLGIIIGVAVFIANFLVKELLSFF